MGEIKPVNRLQDRAKDLVPVSEMSNKEIVNNTKEWFRPKRMSDIQTQIQVDKDK